MKKKNTLADDDVAMFRKSVDGIKPIKQDKIQLKPKPGNKKQTEDDNLLKQAAASFQFSDGFEAHFDSAQPLKYIKSNADSHQIKRLRRGDYPPELILDLHGCNKEDAKLEIAALIAAAIKQQFHCVCIVHGIGNNVLKRTVPNWLVQHPAVLGFHQAPLQWGAKGALLVLIDLPREQGKY